MKMRQQCRYKHVSFVQFKYAPTTTSTDSMPKVFLLIWLIKLCWFSVRRYGHLVRSFLPTAKYFTKIPHRCVSFFWCFCFGSPGVKATSATHIDVHLAPDIPNNWLNAKYNIHICNKYKFLDNKICDVRHCITFVVKQTLCKHILAPERVYHTSAVRRGIIVAKWYCQTIVLSLFSWRG